METIFTSFRKKKSDLSFENKIRNAEIDFVEIFNFIMRLKLTA